MTDIPWSGLAGIAVWVVVVVFCLLIGSQWEQWREDRRIVKRTRRRLLERLNEASRPDGS